MKARMFMWLGLIVGLMLILAAAVTAKEPPGDGTSEEGPALSPSAPLGVNSVAGVSAPTVPLGQPGLSFRYVRTFGVTEEAYLADAAHIHAPYGVGVDGEGNVWVAEILGARAIKYTGDGSFVMSIGTAGLIGRADDTHFYSVADVATDSSGNIWVVDPSPNRVVKYDSAGNYLTQLGVTWESGSDNDHFNDPRSIAFDGVGNIYVSDAGNHRIQVFDSSGTYSATIGETGVTGSDDAHFNVPRHIAIGSSDNLYVADLDNHRVQIFDNSLAYVATMGVSGESGSGNDHFDWPMGVHVDAGKIYVADGNNHRVQIFDRTTRAYQNTIGSGTVGSGNNEFHFPSDVAVDSVGNIYVADQGNYRVQKFNSGRAYVRTFGTTGVPYLTDGYHYNEPFDVAVDASGNIGIVENESRGHRFIKLNASGVPQFTIGQAGVDGEDNAHFGEPRGVAFDASGNIYVADSWNNRIQIFRSDRTYQATLGTGWGSGNDQFDYPSGVAVDTNGNIYVADSNNHRVQIYNSNRDYVATLGVTGEAGSDNSHFNWPLGVYVDKSGNIYVAEGGNHRVQKFSSSRVWQTTLGTTGECGDDFDHFCEPSDVAVDVHGRIFVADRYNNRVQVFSSTGAYLTTIGGNRDTNTGAFREPTGIDVDSVGNVYVADHHNHRIQKFTPGVPGWRQVNINGFGDRWNAAASALEVFNGQLYAGATNYGSGGRIWRTTGDTTWTAVSSPGFGSAYTNTNAVIFDMIEFNGQLYAGTGNWWDDGMAGQIWRSSNGTNWTLVEGGGFGSANNVGIVAFGVFSNTLYASTCNSADGLEIWRSSTGNDGDWSRVVANGFDSGSDYADSTGLTVFNGYLYAAVEASPAASAQVWRTNNGTTWTKVNIDGFGDTDNHETGGWATFGGYLYIGTRNYVTGAQLYHSNNGITWTQVISDGFGDSNNVKIESLMSFEGSLYAGVENSTTGIEVWRSSDGTTWRQVNVDGFGDSNNAGTLWSIATVAFDDDLYIGTRNHANGGEVWRFVGYPVYLPLVLRNAEAQESLTLPLAPGCELYNPTLCGTLGSGWVRHGRFLVGDAPGDEALQLFLSYDISSIPAQSEVLNVIVDLTGAKVFGSPFDTLGCLTIYAYDYGTLDATTYLTGTPGTAIAEYCSEQDLRSQTSSSEAAQTLQEKLGGPHFQVRFQFEQGTDHDDDLDWVDVESHPPDVIVHYRRP